MHTSTSSRRRSRRSLRATVSKATIAAAGAWCSSSSTEAFSPPLFSLAPLPQSASPFSPSSNQVFSAAASSTVYTENHDDLPHFFTPISKNSATTTSYVTATQTDQKNRIQENEVATDDMAAVTAAYYPSPPEGVDPEHAYLFEGTDEGLQESSTQLGAFFKSPQAPKDNKNNTPFVIERFGLEKAFSESIYRQIADLCIDVFFRESLDGSPGERAA